MATNHVVHQAQGLKPLPLSGADTFSLTRFDDTYLKSHALTHNHRRPVTVKLQHYWQW